MTGDSKASSKETIVAWVWGGLLILLGGTAQFRDLHNVFLETAAVLFLGLYAWQRPDVLSPRGMMAFAYALTALITVQLIPIPFRLWSAMPGHRLYADALHVAGIADQARPMSIAPDMTLSCLTGTLPILATIAALRSLDTSQRYRLAIPLTLLLLVGAILGMMQTAQGAESPLRLYRLSTPDGPLGFFSNRNHHALSLAIGIPLGVMAFRLLPARRPLNLSPWLALGVVLFLAVTVLVAGSRGALIAMMPGLVFLILPLRAILTGTLKSRRIWVLVGSMAVLATIAIAIAVVLTRSDRALSVIRLWQTAGNELRWRTFTPILDAARTYLPFGSGFGTFDTVFRAVEPFELLKPTYLNQAHNEPLQILLESGIPGVILALVAAVAIVRVALRSRRATKDKKLFSLLGITILAQCSLVSLADYPLRSPLMAAIALLACTWIIDAGGKTSRRTGEAKVA